MKYRLFFIIFLLNGAIVYGQTARQVLENMQKKCFEINNGKFTLERKFKFLSHTDTTNKIGSVVFERMPTDSLFGFKMWLENTTDTFTKYYDGKYVHTILPQKKSVTIDTLRNDNYSAIKGSGVGAFISFPLITRDTIYALKDTTAVITFDKTSAKDTTIVLVKFADDRMDGKLRDNWQRWYIHTPTGYPVGKEEHLIYDDEVQYEYYKVKSFWLNNSENSQWLAGQKWPKDYDTFYKQPYVSTKPLGIDTMAPNWAALDFKGDSISFAKMDAKLYMVDFWYRGCHPCVMAMPFLQKMHENYSSKGLKVIGLNPFDYKIKDTEAFSAFLIRRNVSYTMAFVADNVPKEYRVSAYPTLYLINKEGKVIHSQVGYGESVDAEIEKIIKEYLEKN